jgi:hypothetical protein
MSPTLTQLEDAKRKLASEHQAAGAELRKLQQQLPHLIADEALGLVDMQFVEAARQRISALKQIVDELPLADAVLKGRIESVKQQEYQQSCVEDALNRRRIYFELRQRIIASPELAGKSEARELNGTAAFLDREVTNFRLEKPVVHFREETDRLLEAAENYNRRHFSRVNDSFVFRVLIPDVVETAAKID